MTFFSDPKIEKPLRLRDFVTVQLDSSGRHVEKIVHDEFVKTEDCQVAIFEFALFIIYQN
jgi:hypothetical protein